MEELHLGCYKIVKKIWDFPIFFLRIFAINSAKIANSSEFNTTK
jgi:hypothetical protein